MDNGGGSQDLAWPSNPELTSIHLRIGYREASVAIQFRRCGWISPCIALLAIQANLIGTGLAAEPVQETIAGPAGPGRATEYDQRLKSPTLISDTQLKTDLREKFDQASQKSNADRMRIGGLQWLDLQWQLNRTVQAGQQLSDLSEQGIVKQADGSYVLDIAKNPQWQLWYRALSDLADPELLRVHAEKLAARGFRARHLQVMQDYVQQNQPQRAVLDSQRLMIRSVKAHRSQAPRFARIAAADAASYAYQFERAREEAKQQWAAGLLERLDKQRQRILISYFQEISGTIIFIPEENFDTSIEQFAETMTSGVLEQHLLQQERELQQ
jgi:hypothetical protein